MRVRSAMRISVRTMKDVISNHRGIKGAQGLSRGDGRWPKVSPPLDAVRARSSGIDARDDERAEVGYSLSQVQRTRRDRMQPAPTRSETMASSPTLSGERAGSNGAAC